MIISAVVERLKAKAMPPLVSVDGAEELESLARGTAPNHGACFVVPFEDRASPNGLITGAFRQHVETLFLVAVVIRRHDDARGQKRIQAADELRVAIEGALAGWSWDGDAMPAELAAARAAPAGNGVTIYVQTWRTERWIEA